MMCVLLKQCELGELISFFGLGCQYHLAFFWTKYVQWKISLLLLLILTYCDGAWDLHIASTFNCNIKGIMCTIRRKICRLLI